MAVIMALFLKVFVIEAYRIPTGSMQPTLIGDEEAGITDRILVDKLTYVLRDPQRWEVAVFRYPLDRSKSFVKRIAGVGPEEFRILNGDLWHRVAGGPWEILRRPPSVQRAVWKRLDEEEPRDPCWVPLNLPADSHWRSEGRSIEARGPGTAAYRGGRESIVDEYLDGYPEDLREWIPAQHKESGRNAVGDLRLEGRVRALPGLQSLTITLREGARSYRFELPGPAAASGARARIDAGSAARAEPGELEIRLPSGDQLDFAAQNLDDRLTLELGGEVLLELDIEPADDQTSSVFVTLEGEGAELSGLMVSRDIHYTANSSDPVRIPEGCYYMLGDNTQDSSDSREWTFTVYDVAGPDGQPERLRGNWRERENPRTVAWGDPDGPLTHLVDEWGEKHWFRRDEALRHAPEPAPFVPREMIQGKALAVFWPLDPRRGIWRLKWVN